PHAMECRVPMNSPRAVIKATARGEPGGLLFLALRLCPRLIVPACVAERTRRERVGHRVGCPSCCPWAVPTSDLPDHLSPLQYLLNRVGNFFVLHGAGPMDGLV